jgi:hypothetical protein
MGGNTSRAWSGEALIDKVCPPLSEIFAVKGETTSVGPEDPRSGRQAGRSTGTAQVSMRDIAQSFSFAVSDSVPFRNGVFCLFCFPSIEEGLPPGRLSVGVKENETARPGRTDGKKIHSQIGELAETEDGAKV